MMSLEMPSPIYLKDQKELLPDQIKKIKETIGEINNVTLTNTIALSDLVYSATTDRGYRDFLKLETPTQKALDKVRKVFTEGYESRLQSYDEDLRELQLNLNAAETKAMELLEEVSKKESFFTVSSVLINSGKECYNK